MTGKFQGLDVRRLVAKFMEEIELAKAQILTAWGPIHRAARPHIPWPSAIAANKVDMNVGVGSPGANPACRVTMARHANT